MDLETLRISIQLVVEKAAEAVSKAQKAFGQIEKAQENASKPIKLSLETSGIDNAKKSLSELKSYKTQIEGSIKLAYESDSLSKLKADLSEATERKKELEKSIKIYANSDQIINLRKEINNTESEILRLQTKLNEVDGAGTRAEIEYNISELKSKLKELKEELNLQLRVDKESASIDLSKVKQEIEQIQNQIQIEIETSGISEAEMGLQEINNQIKDAEKNAKELEKGFTVLAVAGAAAFASIISSIKSGTATFSENTTALLGLESAAESAGIGINQAEKAVQELSNEFFNSADAATALKNLLDKGFGLEEAVNTIKRFKDAAATGKKSSVEFGQAVVSATEGVKNSNNTLLKTAGVLVNFSDAYSSYAKSIGKSTSELTEAEKVQAEYNAILDATKNKIGDAERLADTLAGSQAAAANATKELSSAFGEALNPSVQGALDIFTNITSNVTLFVEKFPGLTTVVTAGTLAFSGLTVVLATYIKLSKTISPATNMIRQGFKSLKLQAQQTRTEMELLLTTTKALHVGLGVFGVALNAIIFLDAMHKKEIERHEKEVQLQKEHNEQLIEYQSISEEINELNYDAYKNQAENLAEAIDILTEAMDEYSKSEKLLADETRYAEGLIEQNRIINDTAEAFKNLGREEEITKEALSDQLALLTPLNNKLNDYTTALKSLQLSYEENTKEVDDYISSLSNLDNIYQKLAKGEELSAQELINLARNYDIVRDAINENGTATEDLMEAVQRTYQSIRGELEETITKQKEALDARIAIYNEDYKSFFNLLKDKTEEERAYLVASAGFTEEQYIALQGLYENDLSDLKELISNKKIELAKFGTWVVEDLISVTSGGFRAANRVAVEGIASAIGAAAGATEEAEKDLENLKKEAEALDRIISNIDLELTPKPSSKKASKKASASDQYKEFTEAWKEYQHLQRIGELEDLAERRQWLEDRVAMLNKSLDQERQLIEEYYSIDKNMREERISALREELGELSDANKKAFSIENQEKYITALETIKEKLEEIPGAAKEVLTVTEEIISATEDLADAIAKNMRNATDSLIEAERKQEELLKAYAGVITELPTGEIITLEYNEQDAIDYKRRLIAFEQGIIDELKSINRELTDYEQQLLDEALANREQYLHDIEVLEIQWVIARQKNIETEFKTRQKILQDALKEEENAYKAQTAAIKKQYSEQIEAAKNASSEKIAALRNEINEIDRLLNQQSIDEADAEYQRKKAMYEQVLAHEVDPSNKYELSKKLADLTAEYEKRKNREALQAQKEALRNEINNYQDASNEKVSQLENERDAEIAALENSLEEKRAIYERDTKNLEEELRSQQAAILKHAEYELNEKEETIRLKAEQYALDTENYEDELDNQYEGFKGFTEKVYKKYKEHSKDVKGVGEETVNYILRYLDSKISEFAEAGRRAGQAYADAFASAASSAINYIGGGGGTGWAPDSYSLAANMESQIVAVGKIASALTLDRTTFQTAATTASSNAQEANSPAMAARNKGEGITIVQNIFAKTNSPSQMQREARLQAEKLVRPY